MAESKSAAVCSMAERFSESSLAGLFRDRSGCNWLLKLSGPIAIYWDYGTIMDYQPFGE